MPASTPWGTLYAVRARASRCGRIHSIPVKQCHTITTQHRQRQTKGGARTRPVDGVSDELGCQLCLALLLQPERDLVDVPVPTGVPDNLVAVGERLLDQHPQRCPGAGWVGGRAPRFGSNEAPKTRQSAQSSEKRNVGHAIRHCGNGRWWKRAKTGGAILMSKSKTEFRLMLKSLYESRRRSPSRVIPSLETMSTSLRLASAAPSTLC